MKTKRIKSRTNNLEEYCETSGQTKTFAVEKGLTVLMDEYYEMMQKIQKIKISGHEHQDV